MPEASSEIDIDRPQSEVFGFLANAENDIKWRPGVIEIKRLSGVGVGAQFAQTVKGPGGRAIAADIAITDHQPDELIGFRATSGPVRPVGRYLLSPVGPGTRVRFELKAELSGLKKLIMAGAVQKTMDREMAALANLKRVLEESA
ncbi:MAG TPA: SRPBCC family protein [Gaiellaceae bacterium]|nr:SRPBCC family protein [Gaiellaceae bacterium]